MSSAADGAPGSTAHVLDKRGAKPQWELDGRAIARIAAPSDIPQTHRSVLVDVFGHLPVRGKKKETKSLLHRGTYLGTRARDGVASIVRVFRPSGRSGLFGPVLPLSTLFSRPSCFEPHRISCRLSIRAVSSRAWSCHPHTDSARGWRGAPT